MAMETVITLAISMGRTIVLPPEKPIYLLNKANNEKHSFTFRDFFQLEEAEAEHSHLKFISMDEYLSKVGMKGLLKDSDTGHVTFPPNNRTDWNKVGDGAKNEMWEYIHKTSYMDHSWEPMSSFSYFPANSTDLGPESRDRITKIVENITSIPGQDYTGNPNPVDAPVLDRLKEHLINRAGISFYDETMQKQKSIHFGTDQRKPVRFLLPFYAFHFFEDWKQALWTKRFVRDHLRYNNELMCAAARVVEALRRKARIDDPDGNKDGYFNTSKSFYSHE
jgi:hypothetical protein